MNTKFLEAMYDKVSQEDYKTLVMNQCEQTSSDLLSEFIARKNIPFIARKYIIDYIVDNDINDIYEDTISFIIMKEYDSELLNYMLEKFINDDRINNDYIQTIFYMFDVIHFDALHWITLNPKLIKIFHDKYGEKFFNDNIHKFNPIRQYCFAFRDCLTDNEKEIFSKKLQAKSRYQYIGDAMKAIDFTEEQKQKLHGIILLNTLAR